MTENKARKNAVRQRMAQTGERYNVARRSIETASAPESHLIGDEETRRIAESFLAASPWLGNVTWQDIVVGPGAEYLAGFDGAVNPKVELGDGQCWSWCVTFTDPSGQQKTLSHESVLERSPRTRLRGEPARSGRSPPAPGEAVVYGARRRAPQA